MKNGQSGKVNRVKYIKKYLFGESKGLKNTSEDGMDLWQLHFPCFSDELVRWDPAGQTVFQ